MLHYSLIFLTLLSVTNAQVIGKPPGFASQTTGGGNSVPAIPANIDELRSWLSDDTPRVILLDREYDFRNTEGVVTEDGCRPDSNTCPDKGQDAINGPDWCKNSDNPVVKVTYDVAGTKYIDVGSDKSIVGVADKGVIRGIGLRIANGAQNVILQNVHITDLNPAYIWGGDAVILSGTDLIWIDHCKFSLIGRQFLVSGYEQAGRVSITNSEFDGRTEHSASCNGMHYWTMLFLGKNDRITMQGNYVHDVSGRAPKLGENIVMHVVGNVWESVGGHAFDVGAGARVLIEGTVFEDVQTMMVDHESGDGGAVFNTPAGSEGQCASIIGRDCVPNSVVASGEWGNYTDAENVLAGFQGLTVVEAAKVEGVKDSVLKNAGVGKLGDY